MWIFFNFFVCSPSDCRWSQHCTVSQNFTRKTSGTLITKISTACKQLTWCKKKKQQLWSCCLESVVVQKRHGTLDNNYEKNMLSHNPTRMFLLLRRCRLEDNYTLSLRWTAIIPKNVEVPKIELFECRWVTYLLTSCWRESQSDRIY